MAQNEGLTFLGTLPVDSELVTLLDAAEGADQRFENDGQDDGTADSFPLLRRYLKTSSWSLFKDIVAKVLANIDAAEEHESS